MQVLLKYGLLQAAGWVVALAALWLVAEIFELAESVVWIGLAIWIAKDVLLYPLVWRSYDEHGAPMAHPREGTEGVVVHRLDPGGVVRIGAERWKARAAAIDGGAREHRIDDGERVRVVGREGMTLLVTRIEGCPDRGA